MNLGAAFAAAVAMRAPEVWDSGRDFATAVGREGVIYTFADQTAPPRRGDFRSDAGYDAARIRWDNAVTRARRYTNDDTKQQRGRTRLRLSLAERARATQVLRDRRTAALRRRGGRARMRALVSVSADERWRTMPTAGPAVTVKRGYMADALDQLANGEVGFAGEVFGVGFLEGYGVPEAVIHDVEWLKLWPVGWDEPPSAAR